MKVPYEHNHDEIFYKSFSFDVQETKQIDREGQKFGIINGLLATFGGDKFDRGGDTFLFGAFADSIKEHKDRGNRPIRMLFQHDRFSVIGAFPIEKVVETEKGLSVEGEINLEVQKGRETFALAKQGVITDLSIGFSIQAKIVNEEEDKTTITKATIFEGSLVDEPMDMNATFSVKAFNANDAENIKTKRDFEKFLRDVGLDKRAAKILTARFNEEKRDANPQNTEERRDVNLQKDTFTVPIDLINQMISFTTNFQ